VTDSPFGLIPIFVMTLPHPSKITIGSRRSALARLQSYAVASRLKQSFPDLEVEFLFKESFGDKDLVSPLSQMPEKGVFTKDLQIDLIAGNCDVVVHSWKDLPIEMPEGTELAATLNRADSRDVLLLKQGDDSQFSKGTKLKLLSSSPRRAYNLERLLPEILPFELKQIEFESIRGNVPTRVRKLLEHPEAHGLILAKAALDRLLLPCAYPDAEVESFQEQLRGDFAQLRWMILPLKENPTAPAQGALALEIRSDRQDMKALLATIDNRVIYDDVQMERKVLKRYGGGCHQKIGASVVRVTSPPQTPFLFLKGLSEDGKILDYSGSLDRYSWTDDSLNNDRFSAQSTDASSDRVWPKASETPRVFDRVELDVRTEFDSFVQQALSQGQTPLVFVGRENALLESLNVGQCLIWSAGIKSWKALARRGYWVSGSFESFGEGDFSELGALLPKFRALKLSHEAAPLSKDLTVLPTYRLVEASKGAVWPDWDKLDECFWMSASLFTAALESCPELLEKVKRHACGVGHSAKLLDDALSAYRGPQKPELKLYLGVEEWWKSKGLPAKT